jgi:thiol:disulfide interchange protein DsbC
MPSLRKKLFVLFFSIGLLLTACNQGTSVQKTSCPTPEALNKKLADLRGPAKIVKVSPSPVPGLCEVIVKLPNKRRGIVYIDEKANYIITGKIFDIKTKKDLTTPKLIALNKDLNKRVFPPSKFKELDKFVAFTYGHSPNVVYLITDPDCPFCKRADAIVKELADKGNLTVKVILYPLEVLHPKAKEKAVALICDKKGMNELIEGYNSKNQCKRGKKKVESTISYMLKHRITATPTFIFPNGEMKAGVLPPEYIMNKIKEGQKK